MKNIILLSVSLAVYCVCLILLVLKLRDILCHPEKYGNGMADAEKEKNIVNTGLKSSRIPKGKYLLFGLFFVAILTGIDVLLFYTVQRFLVGENESIFLGASLTGLVALFLLNIILGMGIIPLSIPLPFFREAASAYFGMHNTYSGFKGIYISALVCFALAFPFAVLSADHYCYYNDEGIGYSRYFQLTEQVFRYEDIDGVKVYINYNNLGGVDTFSYEIVCGDLTININRPNMGTDYFTEQTYAVHQYIEQKGDCLIDVTPPSEEAQRYITEELSAREREIAEYIFGIRR